MARIFSNEASCIVGALFDGHPIQEPFQFAGRNSGFSLGTSFSPLGLLLLRSS
jgi:hypothetical protein